MESGQLETPDLTVTTDYDTAKKIFVDQDQAGGMQAFMAGKIKVQGDMMKMMAMQTGDASGRRSPRPSPSEIKDITDCRRAPLRSRPAAPAPRPVPSTDQIESRSTDAPRDQLSISVTLPPCTKNVSPVNAQSAVAR